MHKEIREPAVTDCDDLQCSICHHLEDESDLDIEEKSATTNHGYDDEGFLIGTKHK